GAGSLVTSDRSTDVWSVDVTPEGKIEIAGTGDNRVREVGLDGRITTIAGTGHLCRAATAPCGDGGPATNAQLNEPRDVGITPDKIGRTAGRDSKRECEVGVC